MGGVSYEDEWEFTTSLSNEDCSRTVVLLSKTGNGKSSTGNSIIGKNAFKSKFSSAGVTTTCEMHTTTVEGSNRIVNVIDTPGLFDYSGDVEHIGKEIVKCINMAKDGIHAVLVVLSLRTRFSREEQSVIESLRKFFGNKISEYMIVVFTSADALEDETLDDYLCGCPEPLKETIRMCGNRCLLFDNKTKDEAQKSEQLQKFLALVDDVINYNGGKPYTDELFVEKKKQKSVTGSEDVNTLLGSSKQNMLEFKDQLKMVELKLRDTTRWLQDQLAKEQAARLKAEAEAKDAQKKSDKEMRILRGELERARLKTEAETKDAQKKSDEEMRVLMDELKGALVKAEAETKDSQKRSDEEILILRDKERAKELKREQALRDKLEKAEKDWADQLKREQDLRDKLKKAEKEAEELKNKSRCAIM